MTKLLIDAAVVRQALSYDQSTGVFTWLNCPSGIKKGSVAGSKKANGYVEIQLQGKMFKAHRLAWVLVHGDIDDSLEIDHIDGDRSNNRIENLRAVSRNRNQQNQRKPHTNNSTGFLGVSRNGSRWKAEIRINGVRKNVGTYETPELAHAAYLNAKRLHHEGCTI